MRARLAIGIGLAGLALVWGGLLVAHVTEENQASFKLRGNTLLYREHPYSGVVYARFPAAGLQRLKFLWRGYPVGVEYTWYPNGQKFEERHYRAGLPHGAWKQWYPNGSVKSLRIYDHGIIDGEVWGWHPNGIVSDYNLYVKGEEITHKSWISDGTPFYNYVYQDGRKVGIRGGDFCKRLAKIGR